MKRVMFYVQHLLGIGHLARASRICRALAEDGWQVLVVTGGLPVEGFPGPQVQHLALPAVATAGEGFSGLVDAAGTPVDATFQAVRRDRLLAAFHEFAPDAVVIEAFPFGRRQMRFELLPLLDAIAAAQPRPVLVSSLRDILQERAKPGRDEETVALLKAHFDAVMVHGDPALARLEETFPLADEISGLVSYTGLVAAAQAERSSDKFDVVVSAGGGAVGAGVIAAAMEAAKGLPDLRRWCIVTGPNLPEAEVARLRAAAPSHLEFHRFRSDFPALLGSALLSVSQAGYNTVCDILQAGCRSVLVPYAAGGETEQSFRAARLAARERAVVLQESDLSGAQMALAIRRALDGPDPAQSTIALDGAARSAQLLRGLLRRD